MRVRVMVMVMVRARVRVRVRVSHGAPSAAGAVGGRFGMGLEVTFVALQTFGGYYLWRHLFGES